MAGPASAKVLQRLSGVKPIAAGQGNLHGWKAKCPVHDDQIQSLQVTERLDLSVGLHCHAGCDKLAMLSAMGLTFADLYASTEQDGKQVVKEYDYCDINGTMLYQTVRYFPKEFKQRRPKPGGGWINDMVPFKGKHVPYRLNELKGHTDVVIVEGEKDADNLWKLGIPATTNIGGAKNWTSSDSKWLRTAGCTRAFIIPDNDEAGHQRTNLVGSSVKAVAIAVVPLELPNVGPHEDVSDWLNNGGTKEELQALMAATPYVLAPPHVHVPPTVLPDTLPDPLKYNQTHSGAADAFCDRFGDRLRFDHTREKWFIWDQHRWRLDNDEAVYRMALEHCRRWAVEVIQHATFIDRKKWQDFTLRLEQVPQMQAFIRAARSRDQVKISGLAWDRDPWLLGVPNGVLNLKTGELRDGLPIDRITLQAGAAYDPEAQCPRWLQFMAEVFDDIEIIEFMRRFCGYSLTGRTSEQVVVFCHGKGRNGKGRLLHAMRGIMGEYASMLPFSSLISRKGAGEASNDLAALYGKRFVTASEINEGARLNEARVKALTGEDSITARFLFKEFSTFDPVAKFLLAVNHKPVVKDDSEGFWRRVRLVPFVKQFVGEACDPALDEKLEAEWPGILVWALQGCQDWQHSGLTHPKVIQAETEEYKAENDPVWDFLSARCAIEASAPGEMATALFKAYGQWCEATQRSKEDRLTSTAFGLMLSKRFQKTRFAAGVKYHGVRLLSTGEQQEQEKQTALFGGDDVDGDLI